jgi:tol-pal system protein YbgF
MSIRAAKPPSLALVTLGLSTALLGAACGTTAPARSEADTARAVESLRAQNVAYAKKVEELENQVFLLNGELDARHPGAPAGAPTPEPVAPPPALPEVKLSRTERAPEPEAPAERPQTLVDDTAIEYSGAAAERTSKRPMLRLWGSGTDASATPTETDVEVPRPAPPPRASAPRAPGPPLEVPSARPAAVRTDANEAGLRIYQMALDQLRGGRHDEAVASFRGFVKQHPQHDLADNAQYWLGECFYDRKDYSTALREFRRVAERFPQGNKAPDALLKVAFSYLALGSGRPARETLQEIVRSYPRHQAAGLAKAKLAELDGTTLSVTAPAGTAGSQKEMQ